MRLVERIPFSGEYIILPPGLSYLIVAGLDGRCNSRFPVKRLIMAECINYAQMASAGARDSLPRL